MVHSKANRREQAVTRELSKVLPIVIVFGNKNNRLRCRSRKRQQKLEESQKIEEKFDKKRISREKHHDQVVPQQISEGRLE
jgi:hypothetical protein